MILHLCDLQCAPQIQVVNLQTRARSFSKAILRGGISFWKCFIHALKVDVDYGGDGSMLTDMVRGTFEIDGDIVDLYNILHELLAMPELSASIACLEGIKDRYSRGN